MDRFTTDELERRVDEVLFYKWDPIGVNEYVTARAEYRSYVSTVINALQSGDLEGVVETLRKIQEVNMGEQFDLVLAKNIATLLLEHREAIERGHA